MRALIKLPASIAGHIVHVLVPLPASDARVRLRMPAYLAGITNTFPTGMTSGLEIPLASTMAATDTPYC